MVSQVKSLAALAFLTLCSYLRCWARRTLVPLGANKNLSGEKMLASWSRLRATFQGDVKTR